MWHTLMALPGQNNLVRQDLYGLRPRPRRSLIEEREVYGGRRTLISPVPSRGTTITSFSGRRGSRPPMTSGQRSPLPRGITNSGHVTSVTQTLQTRMANAAVEAAAASRAANQKLTKRI